MIQNSRLIMCKIYKKILVVFIILCSIFLVYNIRKSLNNDCCTIMEYFNKFAYNNPSTECKVILLSRIKAKFDWQIFYRLYGSITKYILEKNLAIEDDVDEEILKYIIETTKKDYEIIYRSDENGTIKKYLHIRGNL
ncbi:hypothetical protein [uncultured Campylobacter sp.]|uniref:hypothetical protein n=1 Tax=uncultured Campylobacter sp. TaxID=218934 RepID=UPI0026126129|nr:hypothetical protein [uncultured Campylobacter sp.]